MEQHWDILLSTTSLALLGELYQNLSDEITDQVVSAETLYHVHLTSTKY